MKSGFVALVGRPNAGKSTLLNHLVGQKISIVSDKPQTTRCRILGLRTTTKSQMVFVDTPGIHRPSFRLNERMMETVYEAVRDVDIIVHLVDAAESFGAGEQFAMELVAQSRHDSILALNKVDLINKGRLLPMIERYDQQDVYRDIVPISALTGENVDALLDRIESCLPTAEPLYPPDYLTDQTERSIVAEIIRENVLKHSRQELPYSTAVAIEVFDESERESGFVRITASIIVERPGQKKIVIGKGGRMIKQIGIEARGEIEDLLEVRKSYLELNVKVLPGWRNQEHLLPELGVS